MIPDGNMSTNPDTGIAPTAAVTTEDDMIAKVKEYIDRGINALVNQSKVASEVAELRLTIEQLRRDTDKYRSQNDMLDEYLVKARAERNEALVRANENVQHIRDLELANSDLQGSLDTAKRVMGQDAELVDQLKRERDDAQLRVLELEEELTKVKAKVEKFLNLADEIDPPQEPELAQIQQQVSIPQAWDKPADTIINPPSDNWDRYSR